LPIVHSGIVVHGLARPNHAAPAAIIDRLFSMRDGVSRAKTGALSRYDIFFVDEFN
jgi:hypothetical protein